MGIAALSRRRSSLWTAPRPLANLGSQFVMRSFDVSPDGKEIVFDRYRDNSDVVLIDLAR